MAGVSTESQKALVDLFEQRYARDANRTTAEELFAVVGSLDGNGALRRGLTDPSRDAEQRRGIAYMVLEGKVYPAVRELVAAAAASRWSSERDLADALERLGVVAAAAAATNRAGEGALQEVLEDLLRFGRTVDEQAEVQTALTDPRATAEAKQRLARRIAPPRTEEGGLLIDQAAAHPRGTSPQRLVEKFAEVLVEIAHRSIARVTVKAPLDAARTERLSKALNRAYGRELALDVTVDPSVIGGIKVQVGDEVTDGTVQARISDLGRSFSQS